jgi:hypothetical protein
MTLSTEADAYPPEATLTTGDVALFFLAYDKDEGVYYPIGGPFGVFRVSGGHTWPLTRSVAQRRQDKPQALSDALATVERLGAGR